MTHLAECSVDSPGSAGIRQEAHCFWFLSKVCLAPQYQPLLHLLVPFCFSPDSLLPAWPPGVKAPGRQLLKVL